MVKLNGPGNALCVSRTRATVDAVELSSTVPKSASIDDALRWQQCALVAIHSSDNSMAAHRYALATEARSATSNDAANGNSLSVANSPLTMRF